MVEPTGFWLQYRKYRCTQARHELSEGGPLSAPDGQKVRVLAVFMQQILFE